MNEEAERLQSKVVPRAPSSSILSTHAHGLASDVWSEACVPSQINSLQRQLQAREQEVARVTAERRNRKGSEEGERVKGRRAHKVEGLAQDS